MNKLVVDKNVPFPSDRALYGQNTAFLRTLAVGDSFVVEGDSTCTLKWSTTAKRIGIKITRKKEVDADGKVVENKWRIWRVE